MEPPRRPGRIAAPAPGGGKSWSGLSGADCPGGGGVAPWAAMLMRRDGLRKEVEGDRLAEPGRVGMGAAQGARTGRVQGGLGGRVGGIGSRSLPMPAAPRELVRRVFTFRGPWDRRLVFWPGGPGAGFRRRRWRPC